MLIQEKETREVLRQIVLKVTTNRTFHEDLTQEVLVHLWLRETQCPGQTQSWYLQSCRFFLNNHLRKGRSVDSHRHHHCLCPTAAGEECVDGAADDSLSGGSVPALVSAREISSLLAKWLTPLERELLDCLAEGFGVREIAARFHLSHTSVIRCRRRIAALALKLGIEPPPNANGRRHHFGNGTRRVTQKSGKPAAC